MTGGAQGVGVVKCHGDGEGKSVRVPTCSRGAGGGSKSRGGGAAAMVVPATEQAGDRRPAGKNACPPASAQLAATVTLELRLVPPQELSPLMPI